jgi:hypothetical protein
MLQPGQATACRGPELAIRRRVCTLEPSDESAVSSGLWLCGVGTKRSSHGDVRSRDVPVSSTGAMQTLSDSEAVHVSSTGGGYARDGIWRRSPRSTRPRQPPC